MYQKRQIKAQYLWNLDLESYLYCWKSSEANDKFWLYLINCKRRCESLNICRKYEDRSSRRHRGHGCRGNFGSKQKWTWWCWWTCLKFKKYFQVMKQALQQGHQVTLGVRSCSCLWFGELPFSLLADLQWWFADLLMLEQKLIKGWFEYVTMSKIFRRNNWIEGPSTSFSNSNFQMCKGEKSGKGGPAEEPHCFKVRRLLCSGGL